MLLMPPELDVAYNAVLGAVALRRAHRGADRHVGPPDPRPEAAPRPRRRPVRRRRAGRADRRRSGAPRQPSGPGDHRPHDHAGPQRRRRCCRCARPTGSVLVTGWQRRHARSRRSPPDSRARCPRRPRSTPATRPRDATIAAPRRARPPSTTSSSCSPTRRGTSRHRPASHARSAGRGAARAPGSRWSWWRSATRTTSRTSPRCPPTSRRTPTPRPRWIAGPGAVRRAAPRAGGCPVTIPAAEAARARALPLGHGLSW